jgi:hypothetical protein
MLEYFIPAFIYFTMIGFEKIYNLDLCCNKTNLNNHHEF